MMALWFGVQQVRTIDSVTSSLSRKRFALRRLGRVVILPRNDQASFRGADGVAVREQLGPGRR